MLLFFGFSFAMTFSQPDKITTDTALTVIGLTEYIQEVLENDRQLQQIWVIGEVSEVSPHPAALFFRLAESDRSAFIKCVVWNNLRHKLVKQPVKGEKLLVLGTIRVYPKQGKYQLNVFQALAAGEGLQSLRYKQLRSRLEAEGLFDSARKRSLPPHPQTIAVVTSESAAAWGDIQRTLRQRYPGLNVLLSPATVQGELAPTSIVTAIERVQKDSRAEVLILARGGGSVEDLSCFNDERVVRAIASSSIPIITGIGHQRDESLADLVADFSAHTPTAAAEKAVPERAQLYTEHLQRKKQLLAALYQRLGQESQHLEFLLNRLKHLPTKSRTLEQATSRCELLREKLAALDPHSVLSRGYALVKDENSNLVKSTTSLIPDRELIIQLAQGIIKVKIQEIIESGNE
ncbi:MAG: exodeoxyribonuclease VII large subunit [Oscillatoria sp. PMC 1050.18]|nr:exodeoxyribonuclease VII large subunit [Oscillatoria sp. PMC 1050.18]